MYIGNTNRFMPNLKTQTRLLLSFFTFSILVTTACNNDTKESSKSVDTVSTLENGNKKAANKEEFKDSNKSQESSKVAFNINDIPLTTKEIGTFPFLQAPKAYKFNDITKSDLKTVHFAVKGELMAVEGKTFSTNIYKMQESETPFNMQVVQKAYDKKIAELGGVKISSNLLPGQVEKIGKKLLEDEGDHAYTIVGTNDYTLSHVNTYIIRTAKSKIWIELSLYENGGYIYILEKLNP
jgi:OOP family OmpA-OmpF porin